jgi:hypothetical protein
VVECAERKAKRMVLQCINGVGSNPVEGRTKNLTALKSNSNTVWFNFQTYRKEVDERSGRSWKILQRK